MRNFEVLIPLAWEAIPTTIVTQVEANQDGAVLALRSFLLALHGEPPPRPNRSALPSCPAPVKKYNLASGTAL